MIFNTPFWVILQIKFVSKPKHDDRVNDISVKHFERACGPEMRYTVRPRKNETEKYRCSIIT